MAGVEAEAVPMLPLAGSLLPASSECTFARSLTMPDMPGGAPDVEQTLVVDDAGPSLAEGFHTCAVDGSAADIGFLIDGVEKGRSPKRPALNAPMYPLFNRAVGGAGSWPGPVGGGTVSPAQFDIDYARIWTPDGASVR